MTNSSKQPTKPIKKDQQVLNESAQTQDGKNQHPELWY